MLARDEKIIRDDTKGLYGDCWVPRTVNDTLRRYCKVLGIPYRSSHKMRKTYISTLIDAGVNINTIREIVGHKDERTTLNCYCYDRLSLEERREKIERALNP